MNIGDRPARDVPARHRRDGLRHRRADPAAEHRRQAGPRHRQRPDHRRRLHHGQPARRPADRRVPLRAGPSDPVLRDGVLLPRRRGPRLAHRAAPPASATTPRPVLEEIKEGVQWLWSHPPVRTLAITIVSFNVTFGAAWGVLVLYSQEHLGMSEAGFGLLTTASALGGLVATSAYGWLEANVGMANLMRIGLVARDAHPPRARADHDGLGGAGRDVRVRRPRVRVGHDLGDGAAARRARAAAGPGRVGLHDRHHRRDARRHAHRAACSPGTGASPRRCGSASSARRSWSSLLWRIARPDRARHRARTPHLP